MVHEQISTFFRGFRRDAHPMAILCGVTGALSAFYHDSAACLIENGNILAAAQEERFSRKKHDPSYPKHAINFVLSYSNLKLSEVDYIVFFEIT